MQDEDEEVGDLSLPTKLLLSRLEILLEFANRILQRRTGVIDLVHNQDILADKVGHLQRAQIQPLRTSDLGTGDLLLVAATQVLVQRETDGLNGDVGFTGALEEGPVGRRIDMNMDS